MWDVSVCGFILLSTDSSVVRELVVSGFRMMLSPTGGESNLCRVVGVEAVMPIFFTTHPCFLVF